ncbi:MAG: hypothetical protein PHP83_01690 [Clostridia bacterium]|nr:hypothetical protein [Clostridia bacterium]
MDKKQQTETIFRTLKEQEGIPITEFEEMLGIDLVCLILINRRWKYENNKIDEITDLEDTVHDSAGNNVRMYIAEIGTKKNIFKMEQIPFPAFDVTMKQLTDIITKNEKQI